MITIKRLPLKDVTENNKILYNVNNLWVSDGQRPDDYDNILSKTHTKNWVHLISNDIKYIEFDKDDCDWMIAALNAYAIMIIMGSNQLEAAGTISRLYKTQINETVNKHAKKFPDGNFFVRVERVSLKTGIHGSGPYDNLKSIIQSIITSTLGHECISITDDLEKFRVYLFEWKDIQHEFRVFVYQNTITALSSQHLSEIDELLCNKTDDELCKIAGKVVNYFNEHLMDNLKDIVGPNYTMDIALLNDNSVYFIEPNSFGSNYAAGSALFHWQTDHDILCNLESIEFRIIDENEKIY